MQPIAPREIIHFLNELRDVQVQRLEKGMKGLAGEALFEQISFKSALPAVSEVRLEQTLYAEFPKMKKYVDRLKEQTATQTAPSLASLWGCDIPEASRIAETLEAIGFFERVKPLPDASWRLPFIYRPALNLIQGAADIPWNSGG